MKFKLDELNHCEGDSWENNLNVNLDTDIEDPNSQQSTLENVNADTNIQDCSTGVCESDANNFAVSVNSKSPQASVQILGGSDEQIDSE